MGGELEFPAAIIQRIQSFLTEGEAARTTILSKPWHRAWLTRPNLDLDDRQFEYGLFEYAKTIIERYEQSNQKIERFKLLLAEDNYNYCCAKVKKLIVKALTKLGATHLILGLDGVFVLPCEAVFGGDNLVELSAKGCRIYLDGKVKKCTSLESLCFDGVHIKADTLSNIISSCPLIEKLSLSNNNYGGQRGMINTNLDRLRCLVLCYESFETFFPGDSLSKLPFLKGFTILNLRRSCLQREGGLEVQISSCSLEHLKIELENTRGCQSDDVVSPKMKVKLDVPSIRKFTFVGGDVIPELCFVSSSTTREWESRVSFANYRVVSLFWFRELNEFLTQLRQSKIHLSLYVESTHACCDYRVGDLSVTRKLELESLTMDLTGLPSFNCYALLDGLFRLCRPKLITQQIQKKERVSEWTENTDLLWHAFEQRMHVSIPRQLMYGLKDLEDVNAQIFEDDVWRPLLLVEQDEQQRIRFHLKWKPS